jgi:hypothetical protein
MTAAEHRTFILASLGDMADEDLKIHAALVKLGPVAKLRAELRGVTDLETPGTQHALVPLGRTLWVKSIVLAALNALLRGM